MFDLIRPCATCPFRKGMGERFLLGADRCEEILTSDAFQCHKTVDYGNWDDVRARQGANPQQCAGVMSLLWREQMPNTIMQVAYRFGHWSPDRLIHDDVYENIKQAVAAHEGGALPLIGATGPSRARMPNWRRAWARAAE